MKTFQEFIEEETGSGDIASVPSKLGMQKTQFVHAEKCPCYGNEFMSLELCTCKKTKSKNLISESPIHYGS